MHQALEVLAKAMTVLLPQLLEQQSPCGSRRMRDTVRSQVRMSETFSKRCQRVGCVNPMQQYYFRVRPLSLAYTSLAKNSVFNSYTVQPLASPV